MTSTIDETPSAAAAIRLALPKGRMQTEVLRLLRDAGVHLDAVDRGYRPTISLEGFEVKMLKPQNAVRMLHEGSREIGFVGSDWVAELDAHLIELLDTALDPVRIVAAAPLTLLEDGRLPQRPLIVASEYEALARRWMQDRHILGRFVRTYGATEVFPPEDADCIVDNTATGSTLRANGLSIVDELMRSSTRLYAHPRALDVPAKRATIEHLVLLLRSVLDARRRVMVEVNVAPERLEELISVMPCMRQPTVARLHGESGFAVKAAVPRAELPALIRLLKASGATDIVVSEIAQIIP
jgi:ATP phosphoribosyltransferase